MFKNNGNNNHTAPKKTTKKRKRMGRVWPEREVSINRAYIVTEEPERFNEELNKLVEAYSIKPKTAKPTNGKETAPKTGRKGRIWPEKKLTIKSISVTTKSPKRIETEIKKILKENSTSDINLEVEVKDPT